MDRNFEILFLGGVFSEKRKSEVINNSKGTIQFAADALQWNFINGFETNLGKAIDIINSIFIGSFPKHYKKLIIKEKQLIHNGNNKGIDIGFINIFGFKHILRSIILKRKLYKWCNKKKGEQKNIVIYSMHLPFIYAATEVKKKFKNIKLTLVVPDLPEYMDLSENKSKVKTILKNIDGFLIKNRMVHIDSFVLLTEQMKDKLNIHDKNSVVIEGMCNATEAVTKNTMKSNEKRDEKIVLYTGTLQKQYGILELLKAFSLVKQENYRLWICGDGDAKNDVLEYAKNDSRIKFKGQVSRDQALQYQRKCTLLVNPRSTDGEYTKYSFPSKTIEYMLAGKPVLMFKLDGIPTEYDKYLYYFNENTPMDMSKKIVQLCEKSNNELLKIGQRAKEFVLREKNNIVQTEKIIRMIKEINLK